MISLFSYSICDVHNSSTWGIVEGLECFACLLFVHTGDPVKNPSTGVIEYVMEGPPQYLVWYHAVGLIWITEFIFAFQQMTIAGAVVTYYFTR